MHRSRKRRRRADTGYESQPAGEFTAAAVHLAHAAADVDAGAAHKPVAVSNVAPSLALLLLCGAPAISTAAQLPHVARGFSIERIATVQDARELVAAPNGDLFVGTDDSSIYIVPDADAKPGAPSVFATFDNAPAAGVTLGGDALFVGTHSACMKFRIAPAIAARAALR